MSDQVKPYTPFNIKINDFIPAEMAMLKARLDSIHSHGWELWDKRRDFDGESEYLAYDYISMQVFQYLKMHIRTSDMWTEEHPDGTPETRHELIWKHEEKSYCSRRIPAPEHSTHLPNLFSFDDAYSLLNLSNLKEFSLSVNPGGGMFSHWIAVVDGATAWGNLPGEAVTHAWGISKGIWQPDVQPV